MSHTCSASIIWFPHFEVQKHLIKKIGIENAVLCDRLQFSSLDLRRKCASIVFLHKLLHNRINSIELLDQINVDVASFNTISRVSFRHTRARTNKYLAYFFLDIVQHKEQQTEEYSYEGRIRERKQKTAPTSRKI